MSLIPKEVILLVNMYSQYRSILAEEKLRFDELPEDRKEIVYYSNLSQRILKKYSSDGRDIMHSRWAEWFRDEVYARNENYANLSPKDKFLLLDKIEYAYDIRCRARGIRCY